MSVDDCIEVAVVTESVMAWSDPALSVVLLVELSDGSVGGKVNIVAGRRALVVSSRILSSIELSVSVVGEDIVVVGTPGCVVGDGI